MPNKAQRMLGSFAFGGKNAVGNDIDIVIRDAVRIENARHGFLNAEDFGAVFQQDAACVPGKLQRFAMFVHGYPPKHELPCKYTTKSRG